MKDYVTNNVAKLRKERGMTQEEFADSINVSRQTVIAIEKGNYTPSVLLAIKLAQFFNVSVEKLFHYEK